MAKEEKKLLIACIVLVVVLVGGGFLKNNQLKKQEQAISAAELLDQVEVRSVVIKNQHGEILLVKKNGVNDPIGATYRDSEFRIEHAWYMAGKQARYVSPSIVDTLLESLNALAIETLVAPSDDRLIEYGLQEPIFEIKIQGPASTQTVSFGMLSSSGEGRYVYHQEKNIIGLVGLNVDFLQDRNQDQWLETSIVQIQKSNLENMTMGLKAKKQLVRNESAWSVNIAKQNVPANSDEIDRWVRSVNTVRATKISQGESTLQLINEMVVSIKNTEKLTLRLFKIPGAGASQDKYVIQRSDDLFSYEVSEKDANNMFVALDTLVDLTLIKNQDEVTGITVKQKTATFELVRDKQWRIQKPFKDAASVEQVDEIKNLLQAIAPKKLLARSQSVRGMEFTIQESGNKKVFVIDPVAQQVQVKGDTSWSAQVTLPQEFASKMQAHLAEIRKRDLYPMTLDDLDRFELIKGDQKLSMYQGEDGQWVMQGDYAATVQFDVLSIVEELKIHSWANQDVFAREGEVEIHLASDNGLSYTWHMGQAEGSLQMIMNPDLMVAAWVEKDKLDELLKKL